MKFYPYREVSRMSLPLRKGEAEKVLVMLKGGGGTNSFGVVFTQ